MYAEADLLPLSGLQHLMYCRRQWALIHIEQAWAENRWTAAGRVVHERAHGGGAEQRGETRIVRGLALSSLRLGLSGVADVVEFTRVAAGNAAAAADALSQLNRFEDKGQAQAQHLPSPTGHREPATSNCLCVTPVEYKRGKAKRGAEDLVQICAQALCLEEMLGVAVTEGALYYDAVKRRTVVPIDAALRAQTEALAAEMHALYGARDTPPPEYGKKCRQCSLLALCLPEAMERPRRAAGWLSRNIARAARADEEEDEG